MIATPDYGKVAAYAIYSAACPIDIFFTAVLQVVRRIASFN